MKLTRRELAVLVSASAVAAQTEPVADPAGELQAARDRLKSTSAALARHELPATTEPAFRFEP